MSAVTSTSSQSVLLTIPNQHTMLSLETKKNLILAAKVTAVWVPGGMSPIPLRLVVAIALNSLVARMAIHNLEKGFDIFDLMYLEYP